MIGFLIVTGSIAWGQDEFGPQPATSNVERFNIQYSTDQNIQVRMTGRSGNLELKAAETADDGFCQIDYQKGSGFVDYDRNEQVLTWKSTRRFSLNHLSRTVTRVAPYLKCHFPKDTELDFRLDMVELGLASLNFEHLHVNRLYFDARYGDVDLNFPTPNERIIREPVFIHLMIGDLEIYNLGNLRAPEIAINTGIGDISVHFGPQITMDTNVTLDVDIGSLEVFFPRGTHVIVTDTSRNLSRYGFEKKGKRWETTQHTQNRPLVTLELQGPMGDCVIHWN